jgi:uncharacterized protein YlzI (FlbEa/FlbD family)
MKHSFFNIKHGGPIGINVDQIEAVAAKPDGAVIIAMSGEQYHVTESLSEVYDVLEGRND